MHQDDFALTCPVGLDQARLHEEIVSMYERVARRPDVGAFHFQVGAHYAVQTLGYDEASLRRLPALCTARFAGVGRPMAAGVPAPGMVVLDHACGAGMDLLLAAAAVGDKGHVIGVDITSAMRETAREAARQAGCAHRVEVVAGDFAHLPLPDAAVDMVLSNGVLNLATDKLQVLREAWRVMRPGARLCLADVVLSRPLSELARSNAALWAACVGGALTESELVDALRQAGFVSVDVVARHKPFEGTSLSTKFGRDLGVSSVSLRAHRPL